MSCKHYQPLPPCSGVCRINIPGLTSTGDKKQIGEKYCAKCKKHSNRINGVGDIIAKVTQPIAKVIDKVAGTKLENCKDCKKRQNTLNNILPL